MMVASYLDWGKWNDDVGGLPDGAEVTAMGEKAGGKVAQGADADERTAAAAEVERVRVEGQAEVTAGSRPSSASTGDAL